MSQALVISDNSLVDLLYEVNLRAYVGMNITIKSDFKEACNLLELTPNMDLVILVTVKGDNKILEKKTLIDSIIKKSEMEIPIVIVCDDQALVEKLNLNPPQFFHLGNRFDVRSLVRIAASVLEVTAQEMASRPVAQYFPIPIALLKCMPESFCDLFVKVKNSEGKSDYHLLLAKGLPLNEKLKHLKSEGIKELYVESQMRLKMINLTSQLITDELAKSDLSSSDTIGISASAMDLVAEEIFISKKLTPELINISKSCTEAIANVVKEVPKMSKLLNLLLDNKAGYVYQHSVLNTYFATQLIENISWGSKEQISKVSFVLFFHDLFLIPLFQKYPDVAGEEDLLFHESVSEADKQIVLDHAKMGALILKNFPRAPMGADSILMQHHGVMTGQGFAVSFRDDLSPLAKVIVIAEELSNLLLAYKKEKDQNVMESFLGPYLENGMLNSEKIINEFLKKFSNHTFKPIIKAIAAIDFI